MICCSKTLQGLGRVRSTNTFQCGSAFWKTTRPRSKYNSGCSMEFKGSNYDSLVPPRKHLKNHHSCKLFTEFISKTLVERVRTGAVRVWGRVGTVEPPWVVLPITIKPNK
ncbi:hypothetical protein pdam_00023252 [Pocillopora damicornis]|uniref:Uncharacterized protein n=1 Tax=Pocillopora damicornis TaxID=46731 RepID=A0A3M6UKW6_POCDA|nr:hypothetical protein pdam_00023252 [Pocillopora damicornis]